LPDALTLARQSDLDLVEVAPMATPPVCRIMDYGKFRYEESQKAKESRKKTVHVSIKEVKFRPKIGKGDFDTKVRHMQDFLEDGHKVKVTLQFRGREMAHPELGQKILDAVVVQLGTAGKVETHARQEGRNMTMVIAPEKKVVPKKTDAKPSKDPAAAQTSEAVAPHADELPAEAPQAEAVEAETPQAETPQAETPQPDPA
jgi:translation initiation factor IF-3